MTVDWGHACGADEYVAPELDADTLAWCEEFARRTRETARPIIGT